MFDTSEKNDVERALIRHGYDRDMIETPYTFLAVRDAEKSILVDAGAGSFAESTGRLSENLEAVGIQRGDVTDVIITHAHPDHVGGTVDGDAKLTYPNATYYLNRMEWEYWWSDEAFETTKSSFVEFTRERLDVIKSSVTLCDGQTELFPGVTLIPAPGHTPGHCIVAFDSIGSSITYAADTALTSLPLERPDWQPIFDVDRPRARRTKMDLARRAVDEELLLMFQHFSPYPGIGRIEVLGSGWRWVSIDIE